MNEAPTSLSHLVSYGFLVAHCAPTRAAIFNISPASWPLYFGHPLPETSFPSFFTWPAASHLLGLSLSNGADQGKGTPRAAGPAFWLRCILPMCPPRKLGKWTRLGLILLPPPILLFLLLNKLNLVTLFLPYDQPKTIFHPSLYFISLLLPLWVS